MTYLLDTHVFLWAASEPERLSAAATEILLEPRSVLLLSAASVWEALLKAQKGKLPFFQDRVPADEFEYHIRQLGLAPLAVNLAHVTRSSTLPSLHTDPFDRLIVAQALVEGVPLITADQAMRQYPMRVIW